MAHNAVLFDLDGTLLDTIGDIAESTNRALASLGFPPHGVARYRQFVGDGEDMLAFRALPEGQRDSRTMEILVGLFHREYSVRWGNLTRPFPGIPELLGKLMERNLRLGVFSNKADEFARATVAKLLGEWHFDVVLGARPSIAVKPSPQGSLYVAREMGIAPVEFLYLGDSGVDMQTASAAGMYPVGALWGYRGADELKNAGARALIEKPEDLLALI